MILELSRVVIAYPNGNPTALIFDQESLQYREQINLALTSNAVDSVEQVGFLVKPNNPSALGRLEMAGGEFCGNGARSAAYLLADKKPCKGLLEVSGTENMLSFEISKDGFVTLEIPVYNGPDLFTEVLEGNIVALDGIAHLVITSTEYFPNSFEDQTLKIHSMALLKKYKLDSLAASGVCYYDIATNKAQFCVFVLSVDTLFSETACGSGTCAIGLAMMKLRSLNSIDLAVLQPSGEQIKVSCSLADNRYRANIKGTVSILNDGPISLKL
jgi:histidine racemase